MYSANSELIPDHFVIKIEKDKIFFLYIYY